jgi:hypothetical protein
VGAATGRAVSVERIRATRAPTDARVMIAGRLHRPFGMATSARAALARIETMPNDDRARTPTDDRARVPIAGAPMHARVPAVHRVAATVTTGADPTVQIADPRIDVRPIDVGRADPPAGLTRLGPRVAPSAVGHRARPRRGASHLRRGAVSRARRPHG